MGAMCRKCPRVWRAGESHCSSCCRSFSTVQNFDEHRAGPMDRRVCQEPQTLGMEPRVRASGTVWVQPGEVELSDVFGRRVTTHRGGTP